MCQTSKPLSDTFIIIHIGALWTEGPIEKFQFYVLPMKNLFFFPGILLDNKVCQVDYVHLEADL